MSTTPPEWFQIVAPLIFSSALSIGIFWQPRWMHRLFGTLARGAGRLMSKLS